jgi:hypothetical protein
MLIKNVKIFDRNSFPYRIKNSDSQLVQILYNAPVVNGNGKNSQVVGYIKEAYKGINNIYGTVFIHPKYSEYTNWNVVSQEIIADIENYDSTDVIVKDIIIRIEGKL